MSTTRATTKRTRAKTDASVGDSAKRTRAKTDASVGDSAKRTRAKTDASVGDSAKRTRAKKPNRANKTAKQLPKSRQRTRKRKIGLILGGMMLILLVMLGIFWHQKTAVKAGKTPKLAKIEIELLNITADELKMAAKTEKFGNNVGILTDEQGKTTVAQNLEIKLRGNSTFVQEKKPFQLKFAQKLDVFGLGEAKKWVLRSNSLDMSYLRDDTAMTIAEMLGEKYTNRGKFVELYLDNDYEGLYYLLDKIEIGKGRVDLRSEMGVIAELDTLHQEEGGCFESYLGSCMKLTEAVVEDEAHETEAMEAFMADFDLLEQAAEAGDFASVTEVADAESLAQYFLLSEFTNNPDAYASSFYFYKDGAADKIHAGPAWDFDFALGNLEWWWTDDLVDFHSPEVDQAQRARAFSENGSNISKLLYLLMDIPEFRTEVERVWQERMSGRGAELVYSIGETANSIREAAIRDGEKWSRGDFDAEVEYLLKWTSARYEFMEKTYGKGWILPVRVV